jgi:hypothetical protein
MSRFWAKAPSSRMGRSICTNIATAAVNVSQTTTNLGSQTRQCRISSNLALWINVGGTTATANSDTYLPASTVEYFQTSPGEVVSFISTTTATGTVSITECE